jgi:dihydrofolate reductase
MKKVVLAMMVSLDGFIEGPNKEFVSPAWSEDLDKYWAGGNLDEAGTLLFGRVCYEGMAAFWPGAETDPASPPGLADTARSMNSLPKIVFSKSLQSASWNNTQVVSGNIAEKVASLKQEPGKDLVMFGGADIATSFIKLGLIDEYRILITPTVFGGGTPLFKGGYDRFGLKLLDSKSLDTGAIILRYTPES